MLLFASMSCFCSPMLPAVMLYYISPSWYAEKADKFSSKSSFMNCVKRQVFRDSGPTDKYVFSLSLFQQVTFQACNIDEARILYDQLAVLAPIMVHITIFFVYIFSGIFIMYAPHT